MVLFLGGEKVNTRSLSSRPVGLSKVPTVKEKEFQKVAPVEHYSY